MYGSTKHCRWCGCQYSALKPVDRDGFDTNRCKQAFYRAYKKYVTGLADHQRPAKQIRKRSRG